MMHMERIEIVDVLKLWVIPKLSEITAVPIEVQLLVFYLESLYMLS